MSPRRTVEDWRREVYRSAAITDSTRVLLLIMADRMRSDRKVSVPRKDLARLLDRSERRITERVTAAVNARLLDPVSAGYNGHTAVYQGLFPDEAVSLKGDGLQPPSKSLNRPPSSARSGTPGGPTISKAKLSLEVTSQNVQERSGEGNFQFLVEERSDDRVAQTEQEPTSEEARNKFLKKSRGQRSCSPTTGQPSSNDPADPLRAEYDRATAVLRTCKNHGLAYVEAAIKALGANADPLAVGIEAARLVEQHRRAYQ